MAQGRQRKRQKEKMKQTPNIHQWVFFSLSGQPQCFNSSSFTAVYSGKVKTRKIGYTPGILSPDTLHLPPNTKEPHTTGAQSQPKIHQVERSSSTARIFTTLVLHLRCICCPFGRSRRPGRGDILGLHVWRMMLNYRRSTCVAELMAHQSPLDSLPCSLRESLCWTFRQSARGINRIEGLWQINKSSVNRSTR